MSAAARVRVEGTVQGVGFRPYVYRLAHELSLGGYVLNDERGVVVEVEGSPAAVESFVRRLPVEAPPLARVEQVLAEEVSPSGLGSFSIAASSRGGEADAPVAVDSAVCADCLAEVFDPAERRYRYPFTNCTNCGPRLTIVRGVPYDRRLTTMASFSMCAACAAEYSDPLDRRFHAQPIACPSCGPVLKLGSITGDQAMIAACAALDDGAVLAVKGLGGFHLACRADDEAAVSALRARKHREDRPFALMVADLPAAQQLISVIDEEERALSSLARPILIAPRQRDAQVAPSVAPGSPDLGVMLPYTPLHHLLLAGVGGPLVMTSGNVSDEPIAYEDEDALKRLGGIADAFLLHDRPIETRVDDSVMRVTGGRRLMIRRSRGFVPDPVALPVPATRPLLACGAELKSTFCLARGSRAWVGHHIGDLQNYETLRSFTDGVAHFERLFDVRPEVVAHDLHPEYLSTKYALEREGVELVGVQHHHAHLAACLAEHGREGPAVGAIFDGSGYGLDGTVWGGEILVGGLRSLERAAHLSCVRLPGGDAAVREPWRMAASWVLAAGCSAPPSLRALANFESITGLARSGVASPSTSSVGRLFDAVAALCGLRAAVTYEGQAAVELESACDVSERGWYPMPGLDGRETIAAVIADLEAAVEVERIAMRFHRGLAIATADACAATGEGLAVLSGGVFQNRVLLELTIEQLEARRMKVLVPRLLPPNDGGISYGQAAVAAAR
jgi:hydrogenase maturation protein HypF